MAAAATEGRVSPTMMRKETQSSLELEKQAAAAEAERGAQEKARVAAERTAERLQAEENIRWIAFHGGKNDEMRRLFKQYSCEVDGTNKASWTALHNAAWHGNRSTLAVLIDEFGAQLEPKNEFGWSALMAATLNSRKECMLELLARGAALETKASTGKTPKE